VSNSLPNNNTTLGTCGVLVVGAGPAGIAAALTLQEAGHDVLVIDKAHFPRDKCCGDGLTTGALRVLEELRFDPATVANWTPCSDVWLRSPSGKEMQMLLPTGQGQFAAIAPRIELDNALVQLAKSRGIRVMEGHGFVGVKQHTAEHIDVDVEHLGTIRAQYVVAADGMWSPVRKALGV
jgi:2-polyprenyl-6-methoxyphenol hydroxylase-like FAD-dependent oxidoreductase